MFAGELDSAQSHKNKQIGGELSTSDRCVWGGGGVGMGVAYVQMELLSTLFYCPFYCLILNSLNHTCGLKSDLKDTMWFINETSCKLQNRLSMAFVSICLTRLQII